MSSGLLARRQFLTLSVALLAPFVTGLTPAGAGERRYAVDVGLLWEALRYRLDGIISEQLDRTSGRYEVTIVGQGAGLANRISSTGVLRAGRWTPLRGASWFVVAGRESRTEITYDHAARSVEYHARGETFFLRRLRIVDDLLAVPEGMHVDDVVSAMLNYADGRWPARPGGAFESHVVRRRRGDREGVDDVETTYRAELVRFVLTPTVDPATGKTTALLDLTPFSSWARQSDPARIVFGPDRRPESVTSSLMLGTSVRIRLTEG